MTKIKHSRRSIRLSSVVGLVLLVAFGANRLAFPVAAATPQLLIDESGPNAGQAVAFESVTFLRDPFRVRRSIDWPNPGNDQNTRLVVFVSNFQDTSSLTVNLTDNANQTFNIIPENVSPVAGFGLAQLTFRLPDTLAPGLCRVTVVGNTESTNTATFRVALGVQGWRQDLQFLATQLPLLHVNPFTKISRAQFDQAVNNLNTDIPTLRDEEILVRLMRIFAMIGDSHTTLRTQASTVELRSYPLKLYWFSDGLYATSVTSAYRQAAGARLIRIGSIDVQSAHDAVTDLIPHENEPWLRGLSPGVLVSPEILSALRILPDMHGKLVFQQPGGAEFTVDMEPISVNSNVQWVAVPDPAQIPTPLYRRHPELNYWFDYVDASRTLYVQYNVCQNRQDLPFNQFFQQIQQFRATHQVDKFVIDLRNNSGGDSSIFQPLINAVANDSSINRSDRLFVIIGRLTFSSGLFNAIDLRQRTNARFVGEATGGKPNAFGEVGTFRLPNSQLTVTYSKRFFTTMPGDPLSLFPEWFVNLSSSDYLSGRDPAMEAILGP